MNKANHITIGSIKWNSIISAIAKEWKKKLINTTNITKLRELIDYEGIHS